MSKPTKKELAEFANWLADSNHMTRLVNEVKPVDPDAFRADLAAHAAKWMPLLMQTPAADDPRLDEYRAEFDDIINRYRTFDGGRMDAYDARALVVATTNMICRVISAGDGDSEGGGDRILASAPTEPVANDLRARWSDHTTRMLERIKGKVFDEAAEIREFAAALKTLLEWAREWQVVIEPGNVALYVHDCYAAYRHTVGDPEGLDLPRDESMTYSPAIAELDRLVRRLLVLERDADAQGAGEPAKSVIPVVKDWSGWMTKDAMAEKLGISVKTLNKGIDRGTYEVQDIGRSQWRIRKDTLSDADRRRFP